MQVYFVKEPYSIYEIDRNQGIPSYILNSPFWSISRHAGRLSVVCQDAAIPTDVKRFTPFSLLRADHHLGLPLSGQVGRIASALSGSKIPFFAVSVMNGNYFLVNQLEFTDSCKTLAQSKITVREQTS